MLRLSASGGEAKHTEKYQSFLEMLQQTEGGFKSVRSAELPAVLLGVPRCVRTFLSYEKDS